MASPAAVGDAQLVTRNTFGTDMMAVGTVGTDMMAVAGWWAIDNPETARKHGHGIAEFFSVRAAPAAQPCGSAGEGIATPETAGAILGHSRSANRGWEGPLVGDCSPQLLMHLLATTLPLGH
jgi:hypothetical protein